MLKEEDNGTRLIMETGGNTMTWETKYIDATTEDLTRAFFMLMTGAGYSVITTLETMKEFSEELLEAINPDNEYSNNENEVSD